MSLIKSTGRGASWQILGGISQTVIRIGATMILARHLTPEDFGVFIAAMLIYGFFELLSATGMAAGIIVKNKPDALDLSTCFWLIISIRVVLTSLSIIFAPYISSLLDMRMAQLPIQTVSILILISGIGALPQTLLAKEFLFNKIVVIKLMCTLVESSIAVFLVLTTDLHYWSLVIATMFGSTLMSLSFFVVSDWRPKFCFSKERSKYLLKYGLNSLGSSFTTYVANNIDNIVIAKLLGAKSLGYYDFAYRIPQIINERVTGPLGAVTFSVLSKIKNEDNTSLLPAYIKIVKYIAWLTFPTFTGLAVLAPEVVLVLWGEKWLPIVPAMKVLCAAAGVHVVASIANYLYFCNERPDLPFKFDLLSLIFSIILIPTLGYYFGILGVAYATLLSKLVLTVSPIYAIYMFGGSIRLFVYEVMKPALSSAVMGGTVYFSREWVLSTFDGILLQLLILIFLGVVVYISSVFVIFKNDFIELLKTVRQIIK